MRPKLEIDKLYYLKMKRVFIPGTWNRTGGGTPVYNNDGFFEDHQYLVKIIRKDDLHEDVTHNPRRVGWRIGVQILAGTQSPEDPSEQWRPGDDLAFGWVRYFTLEMPANRFLDPVIKKFNPKRLPLYLNWPYGKEFITQLLKEVA